MIEAFLFDIGRVLVQFDFSSIYRRLEPLAGQNLDAAAGEISMLMVPLETGTLTAADFVRQATGIIGGDVREDDFAKAFMEIFTPHQPMWDTVERVAAQVPIYLFSNTSALHETWLMREYEVFRYFQGGVFSWRCGFMKPDEGIYRHAIEMLDVPAEKIGYVDDLAANIATGQRLGFQSHLYDLTDHGAFENFLNSFDL